MCQLIFLSLANIYFPKMLSLTHRERGQIQTDTQKCNVIQTETPYAYSELYDLLPTEIKPLLGKNLLPDELKDQGNV